ncbi:MAG: ABC transporter ATP-binding protein [Pseudomonadota bacterium]
MSAIEITNVTKQFDTTAEPAVNDLSISVEKGSFTCILGPSGCGKSTLLRMIAGLDTISSGQISVSGKVVDDAMGSFVAPEHRGLGLVFQSYALWPHLTVAENVAFGLRLKRMQAKDRNARVAEMLALLQIDGLEDRYPSQLSGGQQQRVALARTLALKPEVLLLDEPLSNLDATLRLKMREELARLHQTSGTTIILVTHDQWEAMSLSTHIAVMNAGQLQQFGRAMDIYDAPANRFVAEFVGNPPINILPKGSKGAAMLGGQSDLTMGIRPEVIRFSNQGAVAQIEDVIPTGGTWLVRLRLAETNESLLHATSLRPRLTAGQQVFIEALPEGVHQFDQAGNRVAPDVVPATRPKVAS